MRKGGQIDHFLGTALDLETTHSEAKDLAVVGKDGSLDGEWVVGGNGSDALDLVGSDCNTETSSANEDSSVGLSSLDLSCGLDSKVWVSWWEMWQRTRRVSNDRVSCVLVRVARHRLRTIAHLSCQWCR